MIILVGGEKGGTGKSTLAINLAVLLSQNKKEILMVDADKQGTTSQWSSQRDENQITPRISCIQKFGKQIHTEILSLSEKYDTIIIDAGGRDSVELRASMLVADLFLTPIRPSQSDAWTLDHLESLVTDAMLINPELKTHVIINQAPTNPSVTEVNEISELLSDFEVFTSANSIIRDRISFRHSFKEGLGVSETSKKDQKAVNEIGNLYKEVI